MRITPEYDASRVDATLEALADRHCRSVVRYLEGASDGVASYDELGEHVAARSPDCRTPGAATTRLHHVLLPKLADANLVEYDPRSGTVRYRPDPLAEDVLASVDDA